MLRLAQIIFLSAKNGKLLAYAAYLPVGLGLTLAGNTVTSV